MKKFLYSLLVLAFSVCVFADSPDYLCISGGDIPSYESGRSIEFGEIPYWSRVSLAKMPGGIPSISKRIAMFLINLNHTKDGPWDNFEFKASTNNFWYAKPEDVRLQYYSQSEIADSGADAGVGGYTVTIDKMWLFVCSRLHGDGPGFYGNQRSYFYITNTLPRVGWTNQMTTVVVLVDTTCLKRHPEGEVWLEDGNADLMWSWHKYYYNGANKVDEVEHGTSYTLWRPIAPVRWFSEMPNWAREQIPNR